jgi:glycerol-3-phosphate dehydrogenase
LRIHGYLDRPDRPLTREGPLDVYGSDAQGIRSLAEDPALASRLHPALPYIGAQVIWAVRDEMARTIEEVLARHTRALFLNARAAMQMARPSLA